MFTCRGDGCDDPLCFVRGFKKISIIGRPSMMSLWFIGTFCTNFVSYQLETWQMLADINQQQQQMEIGRHRQHHHHPSRAAREEVEEKSYVIKHNNLNPIYCTAAQSKRVTPKGYPSAANSISSPPPPPPLTTMRTNSIDDNYYKQAARSIKQLWRGPPEYSMGTFGAPLNHGDAPAASRLLPHSQNMAPSTTTASHHHGGLYTAVPPLQPHLGHHHHHHHNRSYISGASFDNERFLEQHCIQRSNPQQPAASHRGGAGKKPGSYANFRPQTSMDVKRSEYLTRRQLASMDLSDHAAPQESAFRTRNASYSASTMTNTSSHLEACQNRPPTGAFIAIARPPLMGNCSPSSSGSLPASLQQCNWHSYSDSFDCRNGEPASLPLMSARSGVGKDSGRKSQQSASAYQKQIAAGLGRFHQTTSKIHNQHHHNQNVAAQYRWHHGTFDLNTYQQVDDGLAFGGQSSDSHTLLVGSDSELYSLNQKALRGNKNVMLPAAHRFHPASVSKRTDICAASSQMMNPTSDNLKIFNTHMSTKSFSPSVQVSTSSVKKGNSSSKLSLAGAKRRLGFKQKGLISLSVQRCEEVIPPTANRHFLSQMTASSLFDSGTDSSHSNWTSQQTQEFPIDPRINFVDGLGIGQVASRQAFVAPYLGDIQLTLSDRRGMLEVEVVRARRLQLKAGAKTLPSPYVKLYLMKNKKCLAKSKTLPVRQTLDPLYQQQFIFREDYANCILQVIVWGDYGKTDRKSLMGIAQIRIDDLDISNLVVDWYRLFNAPSMADTLLSSKALRQMILTKTVTT